MGSNTHFDPTGEKKARKKATFTGAIICGVFNAVLGGVLGVAILTISGPPEYKPKPDKAGKVPPPPAGLFYWAGAPSGDFKAKEAQFLAGSPGSLTLSEGELNAWASSIFKSNIPPPKPKVDAKAAPKPAASTAASTDKKVSEVAKAKEDVKAAEAQLEDFGAATGSPNFHIFKDPLGPPGADASFQVALPMTYTLFGERFDTVYQARGVFVPGPNGPTLQVNDSYFGQARIPAAQIFFNAMVSLHIKDEGAKPYIDAWAKVASVSFQDGNLVLTSK